jgi:hypothetical protein
VRLIVDIGWKAQQQRQQQLCIACLLHFLKWMGSQTEARPRGRRRLCLQVPSNARMHSVAQQQQQRQQDLLDVFSWMFSASGAMGAEEGVVPEGRGDLGDYPAAAC